MNYVWTPSFPMDDHKEAIALLPLSNHTVEKREFEVESAPLKNHSVKRQRRSKKEGSSSDDGNSGNGTQDAPKDKGRGRYACLNHRMKHKRCPPDCKERRPKPMQAAETSPPLTSNFTPEPPRVPMNIPESLSPTPTKITDAQMCPQNLPPNAFYTHNTNGLINPTPMSAPIGINPMVTVSALPPIDGPLEWDSIGWEGLMEDHSQNQWGPEVEGWDDLNQNSHPEWDSRSTSSDGGLSSIMQADSDVSPSNANDGLLKDFPSVGDPSFESFKESVAPMLLTRDALERWIVEPYFNRLLQGFYVRIRIGEYMDTSVYRIARIDEVVDRAFFAYNLGKEQTTKGLILQIGTSTKKTFSLLSVSNKEPTDGDFQHWEEEMAKQKVGITEDEIRQKADIVRVMNQKYPFKMSPAFASTSN